MAKKKIKMPRPTKHDHPGRSLGFSRDRALADARQYGSYERSAHLSPSSEPNGAAPGEPK